ncbi:MAG: hypothetical protein WCJ19_00895 [bacterium]
MNPENQETIQVSPIKKDNYLFKNKKNILIFGGTAIFILATFAIGTVVYINVNKTNNNTSIVANNSNDEIKKLKAQANLKFTQVMGASFEELKSITRENDTNVVVGGGGNTLGSTSKITLDAAKAKELSEKNIDQKVYYMEMISTTNNIEAAKSSVLNNFSMTFTGANIDYSKPIKSQYWYSGNYTKSLTTQDNKVLSAHLSTPDYILIHIGGKYAVKGIYTQKVYFDTYTSSQLENPELQFIKSILGGSDESFKFLGNQNINGIKTSVYEQTFDTYSMSGAVQEKTRYYIDDEKFELVKSENFTSDGKLIQTINFSNVKEFSQKDANIESTEELKGIEIKTAKFPDYNTTNKTTFADFISRHKLYIVKSEGLIQDFYDEELLTNGDEYSKLINNIDFDPSQTITKAYVSQVASFHQDSNSVSILLKEPKYVSDEYTTISEVTIKLDGIITPARIIELKYLDKGSYDSKSGEQSISAAPPTISQKKLVFEADGLWYEIFASEESLNKIDFQSVTKEDAVRMDKENEERINAQPATDYVKLSAVPAEMRLLPGDLSSEDAKSSAKSVVKSSKTGSDSTCDKYYMNDQMCMIEKFNGFSVYFQNSDSQKEISSCSKDNNSDCAATTMSSSMFNYIVLNASISQVQPYIEKNYGSFSMEDPNYILKEFKGKTVYITGGSTREQMQKIMNKVSLNNGYDQLSKQIDANFVNYNKEFGMMIPPIK